MSDTEHHLTERLSRLLELNFSLATAESIDDLCQTAVERGRNALGVDRLGIWFLDPEHPETFVGSYGIDEEGNLRDERSSRIPINRNIYDERFFSREASYRRYRSSAMYDDQMHVVGIGDLVVAPMWDGSTSIGVISADNQATCRPLSDEACQLVALLARMVGHVVKIKRTEEALRERTIELERLSSIDDLTGVLNRRTGMAFLNRQLRLCRRNGGHGTIVFLDLNGFKAVNDRHGHQVGDRYLVTFTSLTRGVLRDTDAVSRMGGDEFMLILPDSGEEDAVAVMQRLAEACASCDELTRFKERDWFSYGIAAYDGSDAEDDRTDALIDRADKSMYHDKHMS